jgi:hypothetical protein
MLNAQPFLQKKVPCCFTPLAPCVYVHPQVGMFPDVCEALSLGHLSRGDETSAMVASEWYMRNQHFPGWGRPYEFASELFKKVRGTSL